ncbi:MAG: stage II sporulation protein D [Oscillospiraceae bacterium]|nr:stage II sporulation protein D [Oscillospiraceae bacterium]
MKATLLFISIMGLCLIVIPMIALNFESAPEPAVPVHAPVLSPGISAEQELIEFSSADSGDDYESVYADVIPGPDFSSVAMVESFKILNESTGRVETVALRDFVRGAVAAEMPASFHSEALKAQAVAAHTFALHNHLMQQNNPDPGLKGADFKADPEKMRVYITESTARDFYGADSDLYWDKICKAADSVLEYVLVHEGGPIVAAYHAISAGRTEDASNVWSGSAPYLLSVPSEGDLLAPGFETTAVFSAAEVRDILAASYPGIELSGEDWFALPLRGESGYVVEIPAGNMNIPGKDMRQLFGLRSHDFEITREGENYIFTVKGYGHGVGLSQYGADFMARQGGSFDEILSAYYTGTTLERLA